MKEGKVGKEERGGTVKGELKICKRSDVAAISMREKRGYTEIQ